MADRDSRRAVDDHLAADLRGLQLETFTVSGGLHAAELTLPRPSGSVAVRVSGGAGQVVVHRPPGVAVRVQVKGGASALTVDGQQVSAAGGRVHSESPNYREATDRYDVDVSGGASGLTVDTAEPPPPAD